ncbi:polyphenol oxidase family protein [Candidatus Peregrinibacteria bacterium]|nr:polyphenol oxidase family protein [Candidatus Peregrinibacteria bacterium]MBT3598551.1 polyphenol oxidase family protein [Candidatus Peregrinibacteria bacterium]MBT4367628.1 polyphenol oxidase family protein [Candidatus Peregrinibacteria bacterium]MBT6730481.1 polyphenol oxidase family protein [Candidatus Peregrinibacteria bacterium]MBT7344785.1 polyphenol oxidase family protein [Candidatus Peregrinibacteria bacterium]
MIESPFLLLAPYSDRLRVDIFTKEDDMKKSSDLSKIIGNESVCLNQVHGTKTVEIKDPINNKQDADGMITEMKNVSLCSFWGDCQNFVIFAPAQNILGVLHAGWRGINAGAINEFFNTLHSSYSIIPSETLVAAGPSLCTDCAEFSDPITELSNVDSKFFHEKHVDLRCAALEQFLGVGVPKSNIERSTDCTCCMPEKYWTYRGGDKADMRNGSTNVLVCTLL